MTDKTNEPKDEAVRAIEFALKLMKDDPYIGEVFLSAWMEGNTHEHFPEFQTDAWPGSPSPPLNPNEGSLWLDDHDAKNPPVAREWDGFAWIEVTGETLATLVGNLGAVVEGAGEVAGAVVEGVGETAGAVLEGIAEGV